MKILVVEDEKIHRITLADLLKKDGHAVTACADGDAALSQLASETFELVLSDLRLPGAGDLDVLRDARARSPETIVIMMTAYGTVDTAVEALKLGAYDYLVKPFAPDKLLSILRHLNEFRRVMDENQQLRQKIQQIEKRPIIGDSPVMRKLSETIRAVASREYTVLIRGESGTGKELVARALHDLSPRRDRPFVTLNCAALPASLLESELFGHEKGAFTGAIRRHDGYVERAAGGTLFIDEIDDLPMDLQPRLLRVLQEKEIVRVGGSSIIPVDVRILAASKVELQDEVKAGRFRPDLFYRLNIIPVMIPPLRQRKEDIVPLVAHFFEKHGAKDRFRLLSPQSFDDLRRYAWPGNVRELENLVERIIALSDSLAVQDILHETLGDATGDVPADATANPSSYTALMEEREREIIMKAMEQSGDNVAAAARLLELPRSTLRSKLEKWQQ
ncbi:MAG: sigma-54-dependent Fis family transcriptional regulator [Ignavibacteriae bacterium]|nr:sigma-54-dependent Fis family transcriptional regulator [Ignavibacteriota bacterium]